MPNPICGAGDPAKPGWYGCDFPPGHGPIRAPSGRIVDHANTKLDTWWDTYDPLVGVRKVLLESLLARPNGLSTEALKAAYNLVGAVLEAEGKA